MSNSHSLKLFIVLCRTFATVSDEAKRDIKGHGLSLSEFSALELLYHKGEQSIQQIGQKVLLTSGSMTYVIDQLVKKALVSRKICDSDRRITYVEISESGADLMKRIFPQHARRIGEIFSSLTDDEMIDMTQKLKQVSKSITKEGKF